MASSSFRLSLGSHVGILTDLAMPKSVGNKLIFEQFLPITRLIQIVDFIINS